MGKNNFKNKDYAHGQQDCKHICRCTNNIMNEEGSSEEERNTKGVITLGVYIHCQGCAVKVLKSLLGFDGVEGVEIDDKNNKVIVKGKKADPIKVAERLRKKSGKHVELLSPVPLKEKKQKKEKKEEHKVIEVMLKLYLHCRGCAKDVKNYIYRMPGVQTVDPDVNNNTIKVKGIFDPQTLVEFISKRVGIRTDIIKVCYYNEEDHKKNKLECGRGCKKCCPCHGYPHCPELLYAPQLFSDENPNSCSIL